MFGGKLHLYKRPNSRFWQCSAYLKGKNRRKSTKEKSLARAKDVAEDWYIDLRGRAREGRLKNEKHFAKRRKNFAVNMRSSLKGSAVKNTSKA
ncbi:hypothetical protein [Euryhalocaulis caribicus]|uniref:hypothetical protein n=1 Tax=Euryhalocaulis caribicus TaxID=1161401 RepID=UPI0003B4000C|nr:hypothetical protein [Euryhalocaulis caribicus]